MVQPVSNWRLHIIPKSKCPNCHNPVSMLSLHVEKFEHSTWKERSPGFFICWGCKEVREIGVGLILASKG